MEPLKVPELERTAPFALSPMVMEPLIGVPPTAVSGPLVTVKLGLAAVKASITAPLTGTRQSMYTVELSGLMAMPVGTPNKLRLLKQLELYCAGALIVPPFNG